MCTNSPSSGLLKAGSKLAFSTPEKCGFVENDLRLESDDMRAKKSFKFSIEVFLFLKGESFHYT
jgi:hypothetical protein